MMHLKVNENGKTTLILKETMWESIIADALGYATVGALFWFNYNFIGGSYIVNIIILLMMGFKIGKLFKPTKEYTIDEAIKHLEGMRGQNK